MKKAILLCAVVLLAACSRDIQNKEAVRQAVLDSLRARAQETGLNMDGMEVDVTAVSFAKDQARATVTFRVKGAAQQQPVRVEYLLDRQSNKWVVRSRGEAEFSVTSRLRYRPASLRLLCRNGTPRPLSAPGFHDVSLLPPTSNSPR